MTTLTDPFHRLGLVVVLLALLLGGCLSCSSSVLHRRVPRRNLTPQELVTLLRKTSVAFVSSVSKERIERGEPPWDIPYCTGWFLGPRTLVSGG